MKKQTLNPEVSAAKQPGLILFRECPCTLPLFPRQLIGLNTINTSTEIMSCLDKQHLTASPHGLSEVSIVSSKLPLFWRTFQDITCLHSVTFFFCCSFGYSRSIILILLKSYIRLCKYKILLSGTFRDVMTWCSSEEFLWLYLGIAWYQKKSWCLQKWSLPTTLKPMFYFNSYTFK